MSALSLKRILRKAAVPNDWRKRYRDAAAGAIASTGGRRPRGNTHGDDWSISTRFGKILTRFESIERTVPEVLALKSEVSPLRVAVLMLEERTTPRARTRCIVWHAEGATGSRSRGAQNPRKGGVHVRDPRTPKYIEEEAGATRILTPVPPRLESSDEGFVLLPLVVDHGRIFGALRGEGQFDWTKPIWRSPMPSSINWPSHSTESRSSQRSRPRRRPDRLRRELLAHTSAILSSSLEYKKTLAAVVHASVPPLADICVLDELADDGHLRRVEVLFANPGRQAVADRIRRLVPASDSPSPQAQVLVSGKAVRLDSFESFEPERADLLNELGARSMMIVPLIAHGRTLGSLTFVSAESGRRYSAVDLALADEIGRRAAIAVDHARLYRQAQRAILARQDLIAIVSHDLKNPLSNILLSLGALLSTSAQQEPDVVKHGLGVAARSASGMKRILDDLLDVASIDAGHLSVEKQRHEVASIVREAVEPTVAAERKGVRRKLPARRSVQGRLRSRSTSPSVRQSHRQRHQVHTGGWPRSRCWASCAPRRRCSPWPTPGLASLRRS